MSYDNIPRWQCHKVVWAFKIERIEDREGLECVLVGSDDIRVAVSNAWVMRFRPEVGGYFVAYQDSYRSYSPKEAFEAGYTLIE